MGFIFDTDSITPDSGSGGGSIATKYGATINTIFGDVDAEGVLQYPTEEKDLIFTGVKELLTNGLAYKFYKSAITSVSFPDLEEATTSMCLDHAFANSKVKKAYFPKLITIDVFGHIFRDSDLDEISLPILQTLSGGSTGTGLYYAFSGTKIIELDFKELTTIMSNNYTCVNMCSNCSDLKTVRFRKLATIPTKSSGTSSNFNGAFAGTPKLKDIYFNEVNTSTFTGGYTNVFNNMFDTNSGKTNGCTVHFPSNMQSTISSLAGYPTFGGSSNYITIAFDLPATS